MSFAMPLRAEPLKAFLENPIFLSSVSSWFFAQLIKAVILVLRSRNKNLRDVVETMIWRTGGMPSSHVALVSAMATSTAFVEGPGSNIFQISFWFALIIMRDAMGVRRSSGLQAKALNILGRQVSDHIQGEFHPIKEVNGHAPLEVVIGALLGIFIAAAFAYL
ncbi:phosphatidic acid phosphatase [Spirochaetia bacterium]|nr:phosphatidic acid phosphatase [Spirochaetia bacterium]GHV92357.1 phosphatidic acid phosphatase [Spirochaetia bacterium]